MPRRLTILQKRQLIAKSQECPTMTHGELGEWATQEFKIPRKLPRSTVGAILRNSDRILSAAYGDGSRRKPLKVLSMRLENRLASWIKEYEDMNICLSRKLATLMARDLQGQLCDAWDLNFSVGWLTAFMRRHGLRFRIRHGEAASADSRIVYEGRQSPQELTDLYSPADIYNMDETGLCYAMAPARSICTKKMRGVKKDKTRISLAFTANADGSDELPILFLGRAKKPRCFNKHSGEELGFLYRNNKKTWMTGDIYRDWLRALDTDMRAAGRHILLLLDNASSHSSGDLALTNVKVRKLPPNTTALLQPMDAGIIAAFKQRFREKQLLSVFSKMKRHEPLGKNPYAIDQLQAMVWSKEIWDAMKDTDTVTNCYRHVGIGFGSVEEPSCSYGGDVRVEEVILNLSHLHLYEAINPYNEYSLKRFIVAPLPEVRVQSVLSHK
jgi:hypothetical protein